VYNIYTWLKLISRANLDFDEMFCYQVTNSRDSQTISPLISNAAYCKCNSSKSLRTT